MGHFAGTSPWERHVEGDELFYVCEGEVEVTLLHEDDEGRDEVVVPTGSIFVIPRNRWHRSTARGPVSFEDDPRARRPTQDGVLGFRLSDAREAVGFAC